jgi:uncharacterized protein YjaZ
MNARRTLIITAIACLAILLVVPANSRSAGSLDNDHDCRIINVVDDFISYYRECRKTDKKTKIAKWDSMLELKHEDFFNHAIYRKKEGEDRKSFKKGLIKEFWTEIAPKMKALAALNKRAEKDILSVVRQFKEQFPNFDTSRDYYITIAFSFVGKVVDVAGQDVFAIGLESFGDDTLQFRITVAHELFHLYHFQSFSTSGALYRKLWAEGMATYASAVIVPGYRDSKYLNFSVEKMNRCYELLPKMAAELREHMGENDKRLERIYLGAEKNDTGVPPEAGYYVGLQIVGSLARKTPLSELAKLKGKQVYPLVEQELKRLEKEPVH